MKAEKYQAAGRRWQIDLRSALELLRRQRIRRHLDRIDAQIDEIGQPRGLWERCELTRLRKLAAQLTAELNTPMLIDSSELTIH